MVTVVLVGLEGVGKRTIADMLISCHNFVPVSVSVHCDDIQLSTLTLNDTEKDKYNYNTRSFEDASDFITSNWQRDYVITVHHQQVQQFLASSMMKRPFVVTVWVTAPSSRRRQSVTASDDQVLYGGPVPLITVLPNMDITLVNDGTVCQLRQLVTTDLSPDNVKHHARPDWDAYFMSLAHLAERRSNCMKRRVGAVLVLHNRVISTGYNGTPRSLPNCSAGGCPRCNSPLRATCGQNLDQCLCLHAEENAVLEAGRARADGATLYCTTRPCLGCAKQAVQVGVRRVVWEREYAREHDSEALFAAAGVQCQQYTVVTRVLIVSSVR